MPLRAGLANILVAGMLASCQIASGGNIAKVGPPAVGKNRMLVIPVDFSSAVRSAPDARDCFLEGTGSERVYCEELAVIDRRIRFVFRVTPADFPVFDRLVTDPGSYALSSNGPIILAHDTLAPGALGEATAGRIPAIDPQAWSEYVLGDYASHYLFPQTFEVGTSIALHDSAVSVYHLEIAQSDRLFSAGSWSVFWGIQARWSSSKTDRMNYIRFYPVTALRPEPLFPVALSAGVETGPQGFSTAGRAFVSGTMEVRLPFNIIDMTFGAPRWRLNPLITLSLQAYRAWSGTALPDSLARGIEASSAIRYDIPVGKRYYLQTSTTFFYATGVRTIRYRLSTSIGYVVDGAMRVLLSYREGYQPVTYLYDSQLLAGIAFDPLNSE